MIVSSPGRICLFGEHQDYLGLPVIAASISLRLTIESHPRNDLLVNIHLPDIDSQDAFSIDDTLTYTKPHDYFRSGVNILRQNGFTFSNGFDCVVKGQIPIQAGTSSSSALVVSWIKLLTGMTDQSTPLTSRMLADLAYRAEVLEFSEAGGMMDQYTSAVGGVVYIESKPDMSVVELPCHLGSFVLADSLEKKDTQAVLARSKNKVTDLTRKVGLENPGFSLQTATPADIAQIVTLSGLDKMLLAETLRNREITSRGLKLLKQEVVDGPALGLLLNEQHAILRDALGVSTEKIERMLDAAMAAGAYGGKINGSGGGGCMFAYAPRNCDEVAQAIESVGGKAHIVHVDHGSVTHG